MNLPPNVPPTPQLDSATLLKNSNPIVCEKCGNYTFVQAVILRSISRLILPAENGEDSIVRLPVMACNACGNVESSLLADELRLMLASDVQKKTDNSSIIVTSDSKPTGNSNPPITRGHLSLVKD